MYVGLPYFLHVGSATDYVPCLYLSVSLPFWLRRKTKNNATLTYTIDTVSPFSIEPIICHRFLPPMLSNIHRDNMVFDSHV